MNIRLVMIFISYSTKPCDFVYFVGLGVIYIEGRVEINLMNIRFIYPTVRIAGLVVWYLASGAQGPRINTRLGHTRLGYD